MEPQDRIVCKVCGGKNLPGAKFCSQCAIPFGKVPLAFSRPKSLYWICICGVVTAAWVVVTSILSPALPTRSMTTYQMFNLVCGWVAFPMYVMLLAASLGSWYAKSWGWIWMIRWAVIATLYETLQMAIVFMWFASRVTMKDVPSDLSDAMGQAGGMFSSSGNIAALTVEMGSALEWLSILSLSVWAYFAFRGQTVRAFFFQKE